jgi:hypothetical protein
LEFIQTSVIEKTCCGFVAALLKIIDPKPIGCRFWQNLGSLAGFGKAITFAAFQDVGKRESRMQ